MPYPPSRATRPRPGKVWRAAVDPTSFPSALTSNEPVHKQPLAPDIEAARQATFATALEAMLDGHAAQFAIKHAVPADVISGRV